MIPRKPLRLTRINHDAEINGTWVRYCYNDAMFLKIVRATRCERYIDAMLQLKGSLDEGDVGYGLHEQHKNVAPKLAYYVGRYLVRNWHGKDADGDDLPPFDSETFTSAVQFDDDLRSFISAVSDDVTMFMDSNVRLTPDPSMKSYVPKPR